MAIALPQYDKLTRLRRKYGQDFPDLGEKDKATLAQQWGQWLTSRRTESDDTNRDRRLHWSRHRNFRVGNQWISTRDGRTWREPGADKNTVRTVQNIIGPALDFRHGVIAEQRPGFRHELLKATIESREKAEAQQAVAEHYFHKLNAWRTMRDAIYAAQTDGCAFIQTFINKLAGQKIENVVRIMPDDQRYAGLVAQGYTVEPSGAVVVPLYENGKEATPGTPIMRLPEGDLACRLVLAHDTFVDPEARCLNGEDDAAKWFAVRRPRDLYTARIETQNSQLEAETMDSMLDPTDYPSESGGHQRGLPPFPMGNRGRYKECVYDWTLYIAPDGEDIERGMWVRLVGDTLVEGADELPGGVIPFARFTDGSADPSFYPRPVMSDWIGDQVLINALSSMLVQHGRVHGLGRLMALKGTLVSESYNTVVGSWLEYEGMKPEVMPALKAGTDVWQLLESTKRSLEDKTGWNALSRGQVLGSAGGGMQDVSGRAVLGAREMLERTFGAMVQGAAEGATEWAEIVVRQAAWLFGDTPRMIPTVGGRGDLAKHISREQLEGDCSVYVDPATLMPMPAQLRQQVLLDLLNTGRISLAEYQKRAPYAEIRNVYMGDIDQWQRAQYLNTLMEENWQALAQQALGDPATGAPGDDTALVSPANGLAVLWQDDPAVHLSALNEIILNERKPWGLRKLASTRAAIYEQLLQAKQGMAMAPPECIGVPVIVPIMAPAMPGAEPGGEQPPAGDTTQAASGAPAQPKDTAQPLGTLGSVEAAASPDMQQR